MPEEKQLLLLWLIRATDLYRWAAIFISPRSTSHCTSTVLPHEDSASTFPPEPPFDSSRAIPGDQVIIPHHDTVIEAEDHVVVFCTRKVQIPQVEKLFQVGASFF